jgi:hypothetical protein
MPEDRSDAEEVIRWGGRTLFREPEVYFGDFRGYRNIARDGPWEFCVDGAKAHVALMDAEGAVFESFEGQGHDECSALDEALRKAIEWCDMIRNKLIIPDEPGGDG